MEGLFESGAHPLARILRHERILEEVEPESLFAGHAEDLHVLVVDVDQRAVRGIKLHPDLNVVENIAQETFVAVEHLVGLVHLGPVREEGHDLLGARRVEDVIEVKFLVPLQTDVPLDVSSCPEHLRGVFQHRSQLAAEFRGQVTDVGFARKVQHLVRGIVRIYHPEVARPARFVADHLHPEIPHRHMPIEVLQIEPVGLRRLFGTLQIEAQPDDVGQRCEPLAVFVGPLAASVNDVDAGIAPNLVPRGQRHDKQRFDLLRRQQIVFARRLGRQVADVGKNNGIAL